MVGLYRDPDGENIFKNVAPQSEMTVSSPQRKISVTNDNNTEKRVMHGNFMKSGFIFIIIIVIHMFR